MSGWVYDPHGEHMIKELLRRFTEMIRRDAARAAFFRVLNMEQRTGDEPV